MKKYIILAMLISSCITGYAQSNQTDLKSGRNITGILDNNVNGVWNCRGCDDSLQIVITKNNRHYQRNGLNVNFDRLCLGINKLVLNGNDIKRKFSDTVELTVLANDMKIYQGIYRDPATQNYIIISLHYIDNKKFILTTRFPEIESRNDPSKGTVFKKTYELVR